MKHLVRGGRTHYYHINHYTYADNEPVFNKSDYWIDILPNGNRQLIRRGEEIATYLCMEMSKGT